MIYKISIQIFIAYLCIGLSFSDENDNVRQISKLNVLKGSGFGWDYLEDVFKYPVLEMTYQQNKLTDDEKYKIPDCIIAHSIKKVIYEDTVEIIESGKNYRSMYSKSLGFSLGLAFSSFGFGGAFSKEFTNINNEQQFSKTVTARAELINLQYNLVANLNQCNLTKDFADSIVEIADLLKDEQVEMARYRSQMLVKNYGTHFLTETDFGGIMYLRD
jgi:hypothetical protein